jgi:AraC-like DNA-binding protein
MRRLQSAHPRLIFTGANRAGTVARGMRVGLQKIANDSEGPGIRPLMLSSDALDPRNRFDAWREELMLRVVRVDVDAPDKARFRSRLRVLRLPNVFVIEAQATPSIVKRTAELTRDGDDGLVFTLPWRQSAESRGAAGQARVGPGEAVVASLHEPRALHAPDGFRGVYLRLDRDAARGALSGMERRLNQRIPLDPAAFGLLRSYLVSLVSERSGLSQAGAELADRQVRELLAHLFDPACELARSGAYGGIRAARLKAVIEDISARFVDPRLNVASVGRRLGLSERYVQQLLEGAGLSFSSHVRSLRLKRARDSLHDPLTRHLRIAEIAAMAGFNDLSHFNHMFRLAFGETPSDARRRL